MFIVSALFYCLAQHPFLSWGAIFLLGKLVAYRNLEYATGTDNFNLIRARVSYASASSVRINLGDTGGTGVAYYGLDFSVGYAFNNILDDTTPPVVTAGQAFSYVEDQAASATVATVIATDNIGVTKFRFADTGTQTSSDGSYAIGNAGVVRLTTVGAAAGVAQNDFDTLPNSFNYNIQASDAADSWSTAASVTFNITAAAPRITGPSGGAGATASSVSVNENQTAVTSLTANRAVTWTISGGADASKFMISATGVVTFVTAPDFEAPTDADSNNVYVFVVTATDAGGLTSSQTVSVTVLDVADTAPVITGPGGVAGATETEMSVNENQTSVTTLTSSVPASWSITGGTDAARFAINPATGVLTFVAAPNFEAPGDTDTANTCEVQVTATGTDGLKSVQTIMVNVLNVPEPVPVVMGPSGGAGASEASITVDENQTAVTTLTADLAVMWSITAGADRSKFAINASSGVLTFVAAPDYEAPTDADRDNVYVVEVTATDGNNETAVQTIRVSVRDLSEPAPVLTGPSGGAGAASSAISVNENQTAVTTLAADNAVTWVITGGADAGEFRINPATGEISFVTAPDFEAPSDANGDNVYLVEVTATDANNETAVQTVAVTVLDISEAAPVLTVPGTSTGAGAASISVDENQTAVMTLTADRTVVWSITGGTDAGQFAINPSTGVVTFVSAPDFETPTDADTNNVYLVQVSATDANRETAVVVISVTVRDVAEPLPVLTGPSGGTGAAASAISVNENQTGVTVMSADKPVVWAIGRGVDAAKFAIDAASGALTFVAAPDYEAPTDADTNNVYLVEVTATDGNNETAVQTIAVTVLDVVDTSPVITGPDGLTLQGTFRTAVPEEGPEIATLTSSRPITWQITGGPDRALFRIDADGRVTFTSPPDFEAPSDANGDNVYLVEITATDSNNLSAVLTVAITVEDLDDSEPQITGPDGAVGVTSSLIMLEEGATLVTTTKGSEPAIWSLSGGSDQDHFVMDDSTGELSFVSAPSYETPTDSDKNNTYVVVVRATDVAANISDHTLTVQITDVDEVAPRIAIIAKELKSDLRGYAFKSLGDMLAFNEGLFRDTGDCMATAAQGTVTPGMHLNEFSQGTSLDWAKTHCTARYRVIANVGASIDHADGDWTRRGLASVRIENEWRQGLTFGLGLMGSLPITICLRSPTVQSATTLYRSTAM